jgi:hypothetical protein
MINANQITSRLRMMSDQELQRFAEMHKQDPYMFPLAFNESNMRKEMRSAPQGQGAAPQAPVNQQALAAMQPAQLPEDQGIGALNPNMQFADGGLVSFAGGGESTVGPYSRADDRDFGTGGVAYADGGAIRFAEGEEVPSPRYGRGLIPNAPYRITPYGGYGYSPEEIAAKKAKREQEEKARQSTPETLENVQTRQGVLEAGLPFVAGAADVGTLVPRLLRKGYDVGAKYINAFGGNLPREGAESARYRNELFPNLNAALAQDAQQAKPSKPAAAEAKAGATGAAVPSAPGGPLPPDLQFPGASGAGNVPLPSMPGGPGAARAPAAAVAPRAPAGAAPSAPDDSFVKSIRKVYADAEEAQAKRDAQREIEYLANRPESESFKERKAALEEDRADVEKESRMNEGLAWLTFASKVVQPGKNTLQALVEGASAGGEQYSRAQKDLKKAEKERKMGLASLAEAERSAKAGDFEKAQARRDAAATRSENSLNATVNAVAAARGITQKAAYDMVLAERQITSQENIARERNETAIYGHQLDVLGRSQTQASTTQRDIDKQAVDIWTDPAKKMALPGNIKTLDDLKFYLRGMNGLGGDQNAAADFTVRR